jgi:energy-coupling factor transporter ATP-binding protein EcfA2
MKDSQRQPKLIIILGTNGTGKSTLVKKLVANEIKNPDGQVLIVVPDEMEWPSIPYINTRFPNRIDSYVKARKTVFFDGLIEVIRDKFRYGMVVFDDCRTYFRAMTDQDLEGFLIRRRQQMADIIVVAHGFTKVPPAFCAYATEYILFKTRDNIKKRKDVIENYDEMFEAKQRVNYRADDTQKAWTKSGKIADNPHYFEIIPV